MSRPGSGAYAGPMARQPRIHYPGALYHVTLRGNDHQDIFFLDSDRLLWESILQTALKRYQATVHGYCWMTNHMHMIIQVAEEPLASTIRFAASRYARTINLREQRTGHLFERRHGTAPVQDDSYLKGLIRYIHDNPVRAGLVDRMDQHPWSSHLAYAGYLDKSWLKTRAVLGVFGATKRIARRRYLAFMLAEHDEDLSRYRSGEHEADEVLDTKTASFGSPAAPAPRMPPQTLESIIRSHLQASGLTEAMLTGPSRARYITQIRTDIAMDALGQGIANIAEIARRLHRSESAISQAVNARRMALQQIT